MTNRALIAAAAAAIGLAPTSLGVPVARAVPPECQQYVGPDSMGNDQSAALQSCISDWNMIHGTAQAPSQPQTQAPAPIGTPQCGQLSGDAYTKCAQAVQQNRDGNLQACQQEPASLVQQCEDIIRRDNQIAPPAQTSAPAQVPSQAPAQSTSGAPLLPPPGIQASSDAVRSAKQNLSQADPTNPPRSPDGKDATGKVRDAIEHHHVDVARGHIYPRRWGFTDQDTDGNPLLVNPTSEGTTFRYFYQGSYQEAYVEAGSSVAFTGVTGVFPFTAVSDSNVASGVFYGGAPPPIYQNVAAYIPAYGQTIRIGSVQIIGHDDGQPAGEQDAMMLNGATLARGQVNNPSDGGQVTVAKTQTLPGVGPTDDGKSLVDLASASQPQGHGMLGALAVLIGLVALLGGIGAIWVIRRRRTV